MTDLAEYLATVLLDHRHGVAFERVTEGVVRRKEEPGVAAGLDHRFAGAVRQHPSVIGPMDRVGTALRPRKVRRSRAGRDEDLVLVARHLTDGKRHTRIRNVRDHVDLVYVVPLIGELGPNVGFVLVVAGDHFNFYVGMICHEIRGRYLSGKY